ncbi:MAG: PAS domain S-box protein [Desulfomonilaceae bacterium]
MEKGARGDASIRNGGAVDHQEIISIINEGVIIIQNGRIVFANPAFCRLTGKSPSEVIGVSISEFLPSVQKERAMELTRAIGNEYAQEKRIELEFETCPQKIVEMRLRHTRYAGTAAVLAWLTDITERRIKMRQFQRLHTRLRSILDSIHHAVLSFSFNEERDPVDVRDASFFDRSLVEVNPAAETLYGVPKEDFLQNKRSIFDFVLEEDRERVLNYYRNLHNQGIGDLTYRIVRTNGETRWVFDYGRVEYRDEKQVRRINTIIEDITAEKRALDELKGSEAKYRRIFDKSKDMIYIVEPGGNFIDMNPAGLKLLGLDSKEEAAFRNINEFHVDPIASDAIVKELKEKGEAVRGRVFLQNARGDIFEADLNTIAKRDDRGQVISYQGIVTNITEALREKELEAIGQLAGCFADDLTSPLSVVRMNLSFTEDVLFDLKVNLGKLTKSDKSLNMDEVIIETHQYVGELIEVQSEAMTACKEIEARLKEIREDYWRLNRVSNGTGGIIYERQSKRSRQEIQAECQSGPPCYIPIKRA